MIVVEVLEARREQNELGNENGVIYIAGETLTYGRLADIMEKVGNRRIEREVWDVDTLRRELANDPENGTKKYRVVFAEGKVPSGIKGSHSTKR